MLDILTGIDESCCKTQARIPPWTSRYNQSMRQKALLATILFAVCAYYLWASLRFNEISPNGYYNYLARGWQAGHLYVPIEVHPKLLAEANPYNPYLPDDIKVHDMALFQGHYYLYHGPAPALFAFYPYRVLTGKDLPEPIAVFLFVSIAFLANCFTLSRLNPGASPWLYAVLGLANAIPFLLHRIWVYEVAIAFGQATLSVALALHAAQRMRLTGLALGLLMLSRPHLLLAAPFTNRAAWPMIPIGIVLAAAHNYLRFGSPFDFGLAYLIAGPHQQVPAFSATFILPSLYLFLLEPPHWQTAFPVLALHNQPPIQLPPLFFHENMVGAFWLAPFVLFRKPIGKLALPALAILCFLSITGWVTERYLVDFLPLLVLASLAAKKPPAWQFPLFAIGVLVNLLLHFQGPYNSN